MISFLGLSRNDFEAWLNEFNYSKVHSRYCFKNIYSMNLPPWNEKDISIPRELNRRFLEEFEFCELSLDNLVISVDGSTKFLFKLKDGNFIESVLIPEMKRLTVCISSQVGCRQGCSFCSTAKLGFKRSLTASEIVSQIWFIKKWIKEQDIHPLKAIKYLPLSNIVFMGMGEPLDNLENVYKSILIFTDEFGFNFALKKISLSTSGHVEGLLKIIELIPNLPIAISLHEVDDLRRSKIMPINNRWKISDIIDVIKVIEQKSDNDVLIQYLLIKGLNDSVDHAKALGDLLEGRRVKINLIGFNEGDSRCMDKGYRSPSDNDLLGFSKILFDRGFRVMIRFSKGADIMGGCGQLSNKRYDC